MRLIVSKEWLRRRIASDPDMETDAGLSVARLDGLIADAVAPHGVPGVRSGSTEDPRALRLALARVVKALRVQSHATVQALAERLDVEPADLKGLEEDPAFIVPPRTLSLVAKHFQLPVIEVAMLAGATRVTDRTLADNALKFAARSATLSDVDDEGREALFAFVRFLTERTHR